MKILIINGHPNADSFCNGIAEAYKKGALSPGVEIKEIVIRELRFNPNLQSIRVQLPAGGNGRAKVCTRCIKSGKIVKAA